MVLHSDPGALFKPFVRDELMDKMTSGEGQLYDPGSDTWYYYYSFTNPDWFVIFRVDNATLVNLTRHETNLVIGGFTLAAIIIILFGLYLRHASRTVLMNIINAIKTGDVKRAPRLEAMLSKAIETNKQRELSYVRQATIDALTGCKNRRAFDSDIAALMNDHQPFALALVDIDNFKSINDTGAISMAISSCVTSLAKGYRSSSRWRYPSIATAAKSSRWSFLPNISITPARCWKHGG